MVGKGQQSSPITGLIACPLCDALSEKPNVPGGHKAVCTRCGETIFTHKIDPINRCLAVCLAGLLLLLPAISLPIMGISAVGIYHEASLLDAVELMLNGEFYLVALCIFMFAVAIPAVRVSSIFYICLRIRSNKITPHLLHFFNSFQYLNSWAMLHVFMLGIIVSMYKLVELADLSFGLGLGAFSFLLLCSTLATSFFDEHYIWELIETQLKKDGYEFEYS
jgi:paraquat-inducible protein A